MDIAGVPKNTVKCILDRTGFRKFCRTKKGTSELIKKANFLPDAIDFILIVFII